MSMSPNDKIKGLFSWCINQTKSYRNVEITNFTSSWRNGLGFCAILHQYGPEFIDYERLDPRNVFDNCQIAFEVGEQQFGIPALLDAKDMVAMKVPDRLSIITYLLQYYSTLATKKPKLLGKVGGPLLPLDNIPHNRLSEDQINDEPTAGLSTLEQGDQILCQICSQIIYFLERLAVNNKYYHRSCYRQTQLINLKTRNNTLERPRATEPSTPLKSPSLDGKTPILADVEMNLSKTQMPSINEKKNQNSKVIRNDIENDISRSTKPSTDTERSLSKVEVSNDNNKSDFDVGIFGIKKENQNISQTLDKEGNVSNTAEGNKDNDRTPFGDYRNKDSKLQKQLSDARTTLSDRLNREIKKDEVKKIQSLDKDKLNEHTEEENKKLKFPLIPDKIGNSTGEESGKKELATKSVIEEKKGNDEFLRLILPHVDVNIITKEGNKYKGLSISSYDEGNKSKIDESKLKRSSSDDKTLIINQQVDTENNISKSSKPSADNSKSELELKQSGIKKENKIITSFKASQSLDMDQNKDRSLEFKSTSSKVEIRFSNDGTKFTDKSSLEFNTDNSKEINLKSSSLDVKLPQYLDKDAPVTQEVNKHQSKTEEESELKMPLSSVKESIDKDSRIEMNEVSIKVPINIERPQPLNNDSNREHNENKNVDKDERKKSIIEENKGGKSVSDTRTRDKDAGATNNSNTLENCDKLKNVSNDGEGAHISLNPPVIKNRQPPPIPSPPISIGKKISISQKDNDANAANNQKPLIKPRSKLVQNLISKPLLEKEEKNAKKIPQRPMFGPIKAATVNELSKKSTEIKNNIPQTTDQIKRPQPQKRTKFEMKKTQSNESLDLLEPRTSRYNKTKAPAPPRPVPEKRAVRSDADSKFIPYQAIYTELEELNQKQSELEGKGRYIQDDLNKIRENDERYEGLLKEWLDIVERKNAMYTREHNLHEVLKRQELEDRHSDLEYELRLLIGKQESLKTAAEKAREDELLNQILDIVNARSRLVDDLDADSSDKSSYNEVPKKRNSIMKLFSMRNRSNSVGKTLFRIKKTKTKLKNKSSFIFYEQD